MSPFPVLEFGVRGKDGKESGARLVINQDDGKTYYSQHYNDDGTGFTEIEDPWDKFGGWGSQNLK
jgi:hypothetical protein